MNISLMNFLMQIEKVKVTYRVVRTFYGLNPFVIRSVRTTAKGLFSDKQFFSLMYETMSALKLFS
ncbi:hypothetical protein [Bartonella vinsonii]|uniref:hypothetical protein n=1 Tax=Bartonella vinsonii TaxID=33047 RepID=UPI001FD7C397|nr:hypothetical protein [Bartonella vinsonii]